MTSEYLQNLLMESPEVVKRYLEKIQVIGDLDPFTLNDRELDFSIDGVPPISNMDIVYYLVLTHSYYTKEQIKAFKSLQSYKYFESGFVTKVGTKIINNFYIVVGKVKHSQRANLKPLDVWSIVAKDGSVLTAHCSCMAGNSEVCSHVGAMLFAAEYAYKIKETMTCTDVKAAWPRPSMRNIPIVPVREINFGKTSVEEKEKPIIPSMSSTEIEDMLQKIENYGYSSVLMRIVEPFAAKISEMSNQILPSVFDIFSESNMLKGYSELMELSKTINIVLTEDDYSLIEQGTKGQNQNPNWFVQRAGRITASKFKAVCKKNKNSPSLSLIKSICYPTKIMFNTKATHEQVAVEEYKKYMEEENHEYFIINEVGLVVSKKWFQLGASPDRLVFCECHLGGCLEVKCPYLLHANNVQDINEYIIMKGSCLVKENGQITLNKNHSYYYQVQMQIFVTQTLYCDFVIWSPNVFFKERVFPEEEFFNKNCEIALKFHSEIIMPELLARYFTEKAGAAKIMYWCICKGVDDGRPMIKCDGDECETQWFHFTCIGLEDTPNEPWFCEKCFV